MGLNSENRRDIVLYRIERAYKAIEQAKGCLAMSYLEVTANRLYYAAYYAVSALLVAYEIPTHTHEGCIQQFGMHFVQTGMFSKEKGRFFNNLFHMRLTGDYSDRFDLSIEDVQPKVIPTEEFVAEVVQLAKQKIGLPPHGS